MLSTLSSVLGVTLLCFTLPLEILKKKGIVVVFQNFMVVGPVLLMYVTIAVVISPVSVFYNIFRCSIPVAFLLPTLLGALALFFSGVLYIIAAVKKEKGLSKKEIMDGKLL